uniref:organic hydroperoxide resistance protein n=1 Tax=uncultured Sphingomonas sp. TaxID=158754 RepID=UPI0035CA587E
MPEPKTLYTANVRVAGGRDGAARSSDGRLDLKLSAPGGSGQETNPEQLFAAGWSACCEGAITHAARVKGVKLSDGMAIDAEVSLRQGDDGFSLAAQMTIYLPGMDRVVASDLVNEAHRTCPYSKAIKGNIDAVVALG